MARVLEAQEAIEQAQHVRRLAQLPAGQPNPPTFAPGVGARVDMDEAIAENQNASATVLAESEQCSEPYCPYCLDSCQDPDDPTGQADCRYCGGSYAWRQREVYYNSLLSQNQE